jgi:hypothetical protein
MTQALYAHMNNKTIKKKNPGIAKQVCKHPEIISNRIEIMRKRSIENTRLYKNYILSNSSV